MIHTVKGFGIVNKAEIDVFLELSHFFDDPADIGNARDLGSILGSGRSPGKGNGNPFQYFCLLNSMDRGAWWATVHGVTRVRHY